MSDASGRDPAVAAADGRAGLSCSPEVEPLWREVLGRRLRHARRAQRRTLTETARRAGISPQYLSEVERGRKDASSEIIAAIAGALGYSLGEVAWMAATDLLAAAGLTAAARQALTIGSRLRRIEPIGGRLHHVGRPHGATLPLGPVALAA